MRVSIYEDDTVVTGDVIVRDDKPMIIFNYTGDCNRKECRFSEGGTKGGRCTCVPMMPWRWRLAFEKYLYEQSVLGGE